VVPVSVIAGDPVGVIEYVRKQRGSMRQFGLADTATLHADDQLTR
jgi:hypothetical protein